MSGYLPPPPYANKDQNSYVWLEWYRQLQKYLTGIATLGWSLLDFSGSNLTDLETRNHNDLQNIGGGATNDYHHLTSAQRVDLTDGGATTLHKHDHGGQDGLSDNDHPQYLLVADIDDTPVNGEVAQPISSNWAFDHVAASDPHTGYRLESADHNHQSTGLQAGQLDHGLALTGLTDDDHTQYLLASGTRTLSADWDAGSWEIRAQTFESDVATGTAPLVVASTTKVSNLNADLLDDQTGSYYLDLANATGILAPKNGGAILYSYYNLGGL